MIRPSSRPALLLLALASALASFGCNFSPEVGAGTLKCTDRCPGDLVCRAGVCCAANDVTGACGHDGAAGPDLIPVDGGAETAAPDSAAPGRAPASGLTTMFTLPTGDSRLLSSSESCNDPWPVQPVANPPADRWCGFYRSLGRRVELWVVNVSEAQRRPLTCEGLDPACIRLADNVWFSSVTASRFVGDSLFILSNGKTDNPPFRGTISVWRPGWIEPRVLTNDGVNCTASRIGDSLMCVANNVGTAYDLLAGPLATPAAGVLPKAVRIGVTNTQLGGAGNAQMTLNGETLVYSTVAPETQRESLFAVKVAEAVDPAKHVKVLDDAARWELVGEDKKVFFLRGLDRTVAEGAGTLAVADFPTGANPVVLSSGVTRAIPVRDLKGRDYGVMALLPAGLGLRSYRLYPEISNPELTRPIGVGHGLVLSSVAGLSVLAADPTPEGSGNLLVVNNRTGLHCQLETNRKGQLATTAGDTFSHDDKHVVWTTLETGGRRKAWVASPEDCSNKRVFAEDPLWWSILADHGILYIPVFDMMGADLRYVSWKSGATTQVHTTTSSFAVNIFENRGILFTVVGEAGIRYAKLPD